MGLPDLSGRALGRYQVSERLGAGGTAVVYRATERATGREVALKALLPDLAARPGFISRLRDQLRALEDLGDARIVPVYDLVTGGSLTYLTMRLVRGGTLRNLLAGRPLDLHAATRITREVGLALHRAHEAGVVHLSLRPSNVMLETDGSVLVTDFGLGSMHGGAARGGGHLWPEPAAGRTDGRRTDVLALGLLLYEMATGAPAQPGRSTHGAPGAAGRGTRPDLGGGDPALPPELEQVLLRTLASDPSERPETVAELLTLLEGVPLGEPSPRGAVDQFQALIEAALDPVLAIDGHGRVTHCNSRAEAAFGWARVHLIGTPVLSGLIAPRHREPFERALAGVAAMATSLSQATGPFESHPFEVGALHRDGHPMTLEVSLSPVRLEMDTTTVVAFCRDVSARRETERLTSLREAAQAAMDGATSPAAAIPSLLEAVCTALGWQAGAAWLGSGPLATLRCRAFWQSPSRPAGGLAALSPASAAAEAGGLPERAWSAGTPVWEPAFEEMARSARERAAVRDGMRAAGAFPISDDTGARLGALEFFSTAPGSPGADRRAEVGALARRLGRLLRTSPDRDGGRARYKLDTRNTQLAFSCAFMKLLTVHGVFRDFSGWVDLEGTDPSTAYAECTVKTASVDTGSIDRDYHLRSRDFFSVDRYPIMRFRSTRVQPLGDERFRLFGELTIRDVARPVRLEVRLEDSEVDAMGVERITLTATTVISRLDWFLDWERALQAGRWIVGDEVRLDLVVTLLRRPEVLGRVW